MGESECTAKPKPTASPASPAKNPSIGSDISSVVMGAPQFFLLCRKHTNKADLIKPTYKKD